MRATTTPDAAEAIADLVIAMLAVNVWTLERVYALRDSLSGQGLFDMASVAQGNVREVTEKLVAAGYSRGRFPVPKMAERLIGPASALAQDGGSRLVALLARGTRQDLDSYLLGLHGVGPVVLTNFKVLRGIA